MSENENGKEKAMPTSSAIDKDDAYERRRRIEAKEIEEELIEMSNLGMAVELCGVKRGAENATVHCIHNLMNSMKWSEQQAMEALKIPKSDWEHYNTMLCSVIVLFEYIKNLMDSMNWSAQHTMDALKIPKEYQGYYVAKLDSCEKKQET
jgi:hypothetical protein